MLRRKRIKQRNLTQLDNKLRGLTLYSVASIIDNAVRYVADYDEFGIIKRGRIVKFPLNAVPVVAKSLTDDYAAEMMGIYEDIIDLQLMQIDDAKKYRSPKGEKEAKNAG